MDRLVLVFSPFANAAYGDEDPVVNALDRDHAGAWEFGIFFGRR